MYVSLFLLLRSTKIEALATLVDRVVSVIHLAFAIYNAYFSLILNFGNANMKVFINW